MRLNEQVGSQLNNWLEANQDLFTDMFVDDIVDEMGFGCLKDDPVRLYYIEGGNIIECTLNPEQIQKRIDQEGITEQLFYEITSAE